MRNVILFTLLASLTGCYGGADEPVDGDLATEDGGVGDGGTATARQSLRFAGFTNGPCWQACITCHQGCGDTSCHLSCEQGQACTNVRAGCE